MWLAETVSKSFIFPPQQSADCALPARVSFGWSSREQQRSRWGLSLLLLYLAGTLCACAGVPVSSSSATSSRDVAMQVSATPMPVNAVAPVLPNSADAAAQQALPPAPVRVIQYMYEIVNTYPHDPAAFTQGLVFHQGMLYESTGLNFQSSLRRVELETGKVLKRISVPGQYFAEGLALFDNRFFQLTWQHQLGFIYDFNSFEQLATFNYVGEGWGLTHDGKSLLMSNGSNEIHFLNPTTFAIERTIAVLDRTRPVRNLNELEYVNGEIFANIWLTDRIVRIHPQTGAVTGWVDLTGLLSAADRASANADVLNGIAYDAQADRLFVTGKNWPKLFEIKLKPKISTVVRP